MKITAVFSTDINDQFQCIAFVLSYDMLSCIVFHGTVKQITGMLLKGNNCNLGTTCLVHRIQSRQNLLLTFK